MTYDEFLEAALLAKSANPDWRVGQTLFNLLHTHRPDLADQVYQTDCDPFYWEARVEPFLDFVRRNWDVSEPAVGS